MKLYTLGTGSCAVSTSRYNSSSIVETDNGLYIFDAGSPCDSLIVRAGLSLRDVRAVFVTHMHLDHIGGLPALLRALSNCDMTLKYAPIPVFLPESGAVPGLKSWLGCTRSHINYGQFRLQPISRTDSILYRAGHIKISCIATDHISSPLPVTYAYAMYHPDGNLLITGDLSSDLHDMPRCLFEESFHTCLCEATHFDPVSAKEVFQKLRCRHLIFHHVHTPWQSADGASRFLSLLGPLPYAVQIAYDGAKYNISQTK